MITDFVALLAQRGGNIDQSADDAVGRCYDTPPGVSTKNARNQSRKGKSFLSAWRSGPQLSFVP
jgi:hypothetical protein